MLSRIPELNLRKIVWPQWFIDLPMHANLNAMDIKHLFDYAPDTNISQLVKVKSLPEPCWYSKSLTGGKDRPMWRKRNLVRLMRKSKSMQVPQT